MTATAKYADFQLAAPGALLTFLYPAGWEPRDVGRSPDAEVFIAGPMGKAGVYAVSMSVRVSVAPGMTAEGAAEALLAVYRPWTGFRELGRATGSLAESPAAEVEIGYTMPLPLKSAQPVQTPIRERHVFCRRGELLLELTYAATEEDYPAWLHALTTLVRTIRLGDEPDGAFRPLVSSSRAES